MFNQISDHPKALLSWQIKLTVISHNEAGKQVFVSLHKPVIEWELPLGKEPNLG